MCGHVSVCVGVWWLLHEGGVWWCGGGYPATSVPPWCGGGGNRPFPPSPLCRLDLSINHDCNPSPSPPTYPPMLSPTFPPFSRSPLSPPSPPPSPPRRPATCRSCLAPWTWVVCWRGCGAAPTPDPPTWRATWGWWPPTAPPTTSRAAALWHRRRSCGPASRWGCGGVWEEVEVGAGGDGEGGVL